MIRVILCGVAATIAVPVVAQTVAPVATVQAAAPVTVAVAPAARSLPANTLLTVTPMQEISSKHIHIGDRVNFATIGDVTEQGAVAIPRGSLVVGEITFKTGKAVGGKSGKFEVAFRTVQVNGQSYPLTGNHRQEGKGNTVAAVFATLLISGRSAVMITGQEAHAFTGAPIPY